MSIQAALERLTAYAAPYAPHLDSAAQRFGIDTPLRQAHFIAQIATESGGFRRVRENLNYSVDALLTLFGRHRISEADALAYGRTEIHSAIQNEIANRIYGGEWGRENLGNTEPGDGWKFIGRGLKQLTGRANYQRCSRALYGDDRLLENPDLLIQPEPAALSAGWYWHDKGLNAFADKDDIRGVTKRVNGGLNGLADREKWLARAKQALGVSA